METAAWFVEKNVLWLSLTTNGTSSKNRYTINETKHKWSLNHKEKNNFCILTFT
jgi:hypothetical protein